MSFLSEINQWHEQSKKGLVCGIFGCNEPVQIRCNICKGGYCEEHKKWHFHSATNDGILFKDDG